MNEMNERTYIYIYTYISYVCMHACMHAWMYVCMYVCTYVCFILSLYIIYIYYVCMYISIHVVVYIGSPGQDLVQKLLHRAPGLRDDPALVKYSKAGRRLEQRA